MQYGFLVLIPPTLVIFFAAITKSIRFSITAAILVAGFIATNFSPIDAVMLIIQRFTNVVELKNLCSIELFNSSFNLFICLFLLMLGILIELMQRTGSAYAYGNFVLKKFHNIKSIMFASLFLSIILSLDDYFSSLTVGAVMQPITDKFRVARVKLALLVNALPSPLAVIFPFSSWIAEIVGQLRQAGISTNATQEATIIYDPSKLYLNTIPFIFYSFIIIASIIFMIVFGMSFGLVAKHDKCAATTNNLFGGKTGLIRQEKKGYQNERSAHIFDFLFPITLLICSSLLITYQIGIANIPAALFKGSLITLFISSIYFIAKKLITFNEAFLTIKNGIKMMFPSVVVIILIWTLGSLLKNDLKSGDYIAQLVGTRISLFLFLYFFSSSHQPFLH